MSKAASPVGARLARLYAEIGTQLLSVVLLLALVEGLVRLTSDHITPVDLNARTLVTDASQEPFFETHPFAAFGWIPYARFGHQTVNSLGFVSTREIPQAKAEGELRIITLGGSSTVGNGNTDSNTYPRRLEAALAEQRGQDGGSVSVLNAAAGGYSTIESLGLLQSKVMHFDPDIVLVMHGWNDMYYFTLDDAALGAWRSDLNLQAMWDPSAPRRAVDPLPADVQYLSWSQTYLHIREWVRRSGLFGDASKSVLERRFDNVTIAADGSLQIQVKPVNPRALETYRRNLVQIRNLCEQMGALCYGVLQPTLVTADANRASATVQRAMRDSALYHGFDYDTHVAVFQQLYAINREVFGERIVDATGMNGDARLFLDHIHQAAAGTQRLAELVLTRLDADGAL